MTTITDLLQAHSATRLLSDPARHVCAGCGDPVAGTMADHQGRVLEAAGAVIHRTVDTIAELAALPEESVIRDAEDYVYENQDGYWYLVGEDYAPAPIYIDLPATVLHEGTPE